MTNSYRGFNGFVIFNSEIITSEYISKSENAEIMLKQKLQSGRQFQDWICSKKPLTISNSFNLLGICMIRVHLLNYCTLK